MKMVEERDREREISKKRCMDTVSSNDNVDEQWEIQGKSYCYTERVSGVTDSRRTAENENEISR